MNPTATIGRQATNSFKRYLARPDGSAEIHHRDGRVERIGTDGRLLRYRKPVRSDGTPPVTATSLVVTPNF